ncbi:MAG: type 2 lanthipeptide synthetase LanM family protein [Nostoc sp.]|uniref:type 2 lanthipeptide synthetase LanM family protein n=1 Tax=Nostoc sp. TaxID=1180 RepID=UPI002FFB6405
MEFSHEQLVEIVEKASTLIERFSSQFSVNDPSQFDSSINSKIEKWCEYAAKGNYQQFEKRLAWDGLTWETVYSAMSDAHLVDKLNLPAWTDVLNQSVKAAIASKQQTYGCLSPKEPIAFEELFLPFVYVARQKLVVQTGNNYHLISELAQAKLERALLSSLAHLSAHPTELKFSSFRAARESAFAYVIRQSQNIVSRVHYEAFINTMLNEDGLIDFYQEYPVLARLVAIRTTFWFNVVEELLWRLAADFDEIQRTFQQETLGQVVDIEYGLSDFHNNHHTVIILTFASGFKLVYKPKDLAIDEAFLNLLSWFNQQENLLSFKCLKVLNRSNYGWAEFVQPSPCQDKQAIQRYYQRTGMLLGVLHLLRASDCHCENLIACGEYPVIVDLETLIEPQFLVERDSSKPINALSLAEQLLNKDSILCTNLLPRWLGVDGINAYDISALGSSDEQEIDASQPRFLNINTDNMYIKQEPIKLKTAKNLPLLDNCLIAPDDYVEDLIAGFQQMYHFLLSHQEVLLASHSPLSQFIHRRIRFIFRGTQIYNVLQINALQPECLKDGVEYSIQLEALSRSFLVTETKPLFWSLLHEELRSMAQMDVPYFTTFSDSHQLFTGFSNIPLLNSLKNSYLDVVNRLQQLSEEDSVRQIEIIRGSFYAKTINKSDGILSNVVEQTGLSLEGIPLLSQEQCLQQAIAIATEIQLQAIRADDGSAAWIGLNYLPKVERFQLSSLGYGLYDGSCGIALFLAALWSVTKDNQFRNLALEALLPLRQDLQSLDRDNRQRFAKLIRADMELGSILYALVRISQLLEEPTLLESAKQGACFITLDKSKNTQELDMISELAGVILGLLALQIASGDIIYLEQAISYGYYILSHEITSHVGLKRATTGKNPWISFAHGIDRIAYALLKLYETTLDVNFLVGVKEIIAYERSHGFSGNGLAYLSSFAVLDTDEIPQQIENTLNTIQQVSFDRVDRLCCGNFGIIDILIEGSYQLSRPSLLTSAQQRAAWVVNRAEENGSFCLFSTSDKHIYNPSFFTGTSGIGYGLLRLSYPDLFPSILLFC